MSYVIDSDVFIDAKNRYYGFDICPGFWTWLETAQTQGDVCSVERIADELRGGQDELSEWASDHAGFFVSPDQQLSTAFAS